MTPRDLARELQHLRQLAKALLGAIDQLEQRVEAGGGVGRTTPPPARPTTRIRRAGGKPPSPVLEDDAPPTPRAGGTYRFTTSPKKR